ncbi:MAG TPA: hypothetical protein VHP61_08085 [Acidobacteriota bacterium]|nr:hypothetical protein [Acidobacteriota bacterium]
MRFVFLFLLVAAAAAPQTQELGQGVFYNSEGAILIAVDAGVAVRKVDSPYVMFMAFMAAAGNVNIVMDRADVVMVYKDVEYKMPTFKDFKKTYSSGGNDLSLYRNLGKESLSLSPMRHFQFPGTTDFFPLLGQADVSLTNEGSMAGTIGFRTKLYFKNPGFKTGDTLVIKVRDKKNPDLIGAVAVVLK